MNQDQDRNRCGITLDRLGGANPSELGTSIRNLGASFQARNVFPAAEEQYERARPLLEASLGGNDSYNFV